MKHQLIAAINDVNAKRIARLERDLHAIAELAECHCEPVIHAVAIRAINNGPEIDLVGELRRRDMLHDESMQ